MRIIRQKKVMLEMAVALFVLFAFLVGHDLECQSVLKVIDIHRALGTTYQCRTYQRQIQFFSETALIMLSGPEPNCFRSADQVSLNVISIDGKVIAKKDLASADPGIVIAPEQLALASTNGLDILDKNLTIIQSLKSPQPKWMPVLSIHQQGTVSVELNGHEYIYGGIPLAIQKELLVQNDKDLRSIFAFTFSDGTKLVRDGQSIIARKTGSLARVVADLDWIVPVCKKYEYCQMYDAPVSFQVTSGHKRRILVYSNGSHFPITDAAGLFPYFRLQVFDFDSGVEIHREEYLTRTGERSASISPDGDILAVSDNRKVVISRLP